MNPVSEPESKFRFFFSFLLLNLFQALNTQISFLKTTERRLNTPENEEEMVFDKVNIGSEMRIGDENELPTRKVNLIKKKSENNNKFKETL